MTRKKERLRRVTRWSIVVAIGAVLSLYIWSRAPGILAILPLIAALVAGHRLMIAPKGVAVLTYHSVSAAPSWLPWSPEISVHPATFERHLATLLRMGCVVVGTRGYLDRRLAGEAPPGDTVILHFDDGYLDNWQNAVPALDRHGMSGTFFVSLDFIEPEEELRPCDGDTSGYMNWSEIGAIEEHPLFEVEPHGVGHARVPVSDRPVDRLTADNWRSLAWVQWAATPGPKHNWFRTDRPVAVPLGTVVLESGLALAERAWTADGLEDQSGLEQRITDDLERCQRVFQERLGRSPRIFCWPENVVGPEGRRIAAALGYRGTTGGRGRNTATEPPAIISRIHMGDRALGFRWLFAEGLHVRAAVRLAQGNHYWYLLVAPMNLLRSLVMAARARIGPLV
ncbi:polysaccharide deacetylase family protein [Sphingomonas sp. ERG5]|uniref:polysaccharide deacetylase family protein n=1 Tax=Sphingomonas sp. ERG5 TaxID=1381597 RepID=UPI00054C3A4B|nr:polysaccharide deacetylase family protein [Sphingomonas sp. ERG5]